jgi:hypothetical protein
MNSYSGTMEKSGFDAQNQPSNVLDFYQRNKIAAMLDAFIGSGKFHWNKLVHRAHTHNIGKTLPFLAKIDALHYHVGRDELGVLRGGNPHWLYLQNLCDPSLNDKDKFKKLCRTLAQLPGNVAFAFKASPDIKDAEIVRAAFKKAGFTNIPRKTYLYNGVGLDTDPVKQLKSDARTKVNSARRDLEFAAMSVDEFFAFYNRNLEVSGKKSHFFLGIDHDMIKKSDQIDIIAVRRKSADGKTYPIEAAITCGWGEDGYYKLMRITYLHENTPGLDFAPHKHAIKMLVVEAMTRATNKGMILDVDGATPGGGTVYSRFGVFTEILHDEYKRKTAHTFLCKYISPTMSEALGRFLSFTSTGLFCA